MGAALSFLVFVNARCKNIFCCTSVAAVQPPIVRRTGGFLKKRMTTIYVDSRKRVAGLDSDLGESLHLQSHARLAVYKIRIADSFLSTDRGRCLYWVDATRAPGCQPGSAPTLLLPPSVAYDGNRLILSSSSLTLWTTPPCRPPSKPSASTTCLAPASSPAGSRSLSS